MYRTSPNPQTVTGKNKDVLPSSGKRVSRSASFSEPSPKRGSETTLRIVRRKRSSDPTGSPGNGKRKRTHKDADNRNDGYCWTCHKEGVLIPCEVCPRSFHARCASIEREEDADEDEEWVCPECDLVLKAENVDLRSNAMQALSVDQLCNLLKFAVSRMKHQCPEEFVKPVPLDQFPTYSNFIVHPMDLETLEKNIKRKMYGCTESFLADAKWILHNCIIFNGYNHKLTSAAKALLKICKHEMSEIEVCPDCYHNAYTKRENWFQEPCCPPHLLIWAKLKGFPFWPAKAMRIVSGNVDVRFFGAHDRAWIPVAQCFLLSNDIPTTMKIKKKGVFEQSMEELAQHIKKVKDRFRVFHYAPYRTVISADDLAIHVQDMLPGVNLKDFSRAFVGKSGPPLEGRLASDQNSVDGGAYTSRSRISQDSEAVGRGIKREVVSPTKLLKYPVCEIPKLDHGRAVRPRAESVKKLESAIEKIKSFGRDLEAGPEDVPPIPLERDHDRESEDDQSGASDQPESGASPARCLSGSDKDPIIVVPSGGFVDACEVSSTTSAIVPRSWPTIGDEGEAKTTTKVASEEDEDTEREKRSLEEDEKVVRSDNDRPPSEGDGDRTGTSSEMERPLGEEALQGETVGPQPCENPVRDAKVDVPIDAGDHILESDRSRRTEAPVEGESVEAKCAPRETSDGPEGEELKPDRSDVQRSPDGIRTGDPEAEHSRKDSPCGSGDDHQEPRPSVSESVPGPADTPTTASSDVSSPPDPRPPDVDANEDGGLTILSVTSLSKDSDLLDATESDEIFAPSENVEAVRTPIRDGSVEEGELVIDLDGDRDDGHGGGAESSKKRHARSPFGGIKWREKKAGKEKEKRSCSASRSKGKSISSLETSPLANAGVSVPGTSGAATVRTHLPMLSPLGLRIPRHVTLQQASPRSMPALQPRPSISSTVQATAGSFPRPSEDAGLGKYSQKMVDFVRGTMEEMVKDLAKTGNPEATIKTLQLELEKLQWKHRQEMIEMKHNTDLILLEMRNSMESEKQRAIADVRRQCEAEKQKAIEETKKKQWCAFCGKEAIFYCCWNTSYCDYPCQQAHWPQHVDVCSQTLTSGESAPTAGDARAREEASSDGGRGTSRRQGARNHKPAEMQTEHRQVMLGPSQLQGGGPMTTAVTSVQVLPPNALHGGPSFQLQYVGNPSSTATVLQAPFTAGPVTNTGGFALPQGMGGPAPGAMFQQRPLQVKYFYPA